MIAVSPAWPLDYDDLEPYYTEAEYLYQVRRALLVRDLDGHFVQTCRPLSKLILANHRHREYSEMGVKDMAPHPVQGLENWQSLLETLTNARGAIKYFVKSPTIEEVAMTATSATLEAVVKGRVREARLQPEFASLYPWIRSGQWQPASVLADCVLAGRLLRGASSAIQGRVLADEHFEFRGGEAGRQGERVGYRLRREVH